MVFGHVCRHLRARRRSVSSTTRGDAIAQMMRRDRAHAAIALCSRCTRARSRRRHRIRLHRPIELKRLSVEQLMQINVTSVSRQPEKLSEAASAIQVITNDEIRRSGATSIPEALRLAPNLEVAQVGAHQWAITARGFNSTTANKLLVLIDGRSVYTPLFSGVFWDIQDVLLEDIDRIEVISGPGGAVWGANAVNGVINIITKSATGHAGTLRRGGWRLDAERLWRRALRRRDGRARLLSRVRPVLRPRQRGLHERRRRHGFVAHGPGRSSHRRAAIVARRADGEGRWLWRERARAHRRHVHRGRRQRHDALVAHDLADVGRIAPAVLRSHTALESRAGQPVRAIRHAEGSARHVRSRFRASICARCAQPRRVGARLSLHARRRRQLASARLLSRSGSITVS